MVLQINLFSQQPDLLFDVNPGIGNGTEDDYTTTVGSQYFFYGFTTTNGRELWVTDGTPAGTHIVKDLYPGIANGVTNLPITIFKNKVWFSARNSTEGYELWSSDGTSSGTVSINVNGNSNDSHPELMAAGTEHLYFAAYDENNVRALWRTDGTAMGTVKIVTEVGGAPLTQIRQVVTIANTAYFSLFGETGSQLWKTDGTVASTVLVKDIANGGFGGIDQLTVIDNKLYFAGDNSFSSNFEPWVSDGTTAGTILLQDINPFGNSDPQWFYGFKGKVYFITSDGSLRRTDGTSAGTEQFGNFFIPALPTDPINFLADANYLYFGGKQSGTGLGIELWRTDGTLSSTGLVKDLNPGSADSNPREFTFANEKLYFQANLDGNGSELVVSNGTAAGTQQLSDLVPGTNGSSPRHIAQISSHLVFIADHPNNGTELFTLGLTTRTFSQIQPNIDLHIFPNPVVDQTVLTLPVDCNWQHSQLRLFNVNGQLVLEKIPTGTDFLLIVQNLSSGIYWLEYSDASGHFGRTKIVKE